MDFEPIIWETWTLWTAILRGTDLITSSHIQKNKCLYYPMVAE